MSIDISICLDSRDIRVSCWVDSGYAINDLTMIDEVTEEIVELDDLSGSAIDYLLLKLEHLARCEAAIND